MPMHLLNILKMFYIKHSYWKEDGCVTPLWRISYKSDSTNLSVINDFYAHGGSHANGFVSDTRRLDLRYVSGGVLTLQITNTVPKEGSVCAGVTLCCLAVSAVKVKSVPWVAVGSKWVKGHWVVRCALVIGKCLMIHGDINRNLAHLQLLKNEIDET
jgi:hypothetical protein